MSEWIRVDPELSRRPLPQRTGGVEINLYLSPYDVPKFVRGFRVEKTGRFMIEFRYISEEPVRREEPDENVAFMVGKNSGRLYGIDVNVKKLGVDAVQLRMHIAQVVEKAFEKQLDRLRDAHTAPRMDRSANFEAAKEAFTQAKDEVFAGINS